jgi:hypothetical protein
MFSYRATYIVIVPIVTSFILAPYLLRTRRKQTEMRVDRTSIVAISIEPCNSEHRLILLAAGPILHHDNKAESIDLFRLRSFMR